MAETDRSLKLNPIKFEETFDEDKDIINLPE